MDRVIASYLDERFRFVATQTPDRVRSRADALAGGLNCVALAHLLLADLFGVELPMTHRAVECSSDRERFEVIDDTEAPELGDLLWLGWSEPQVPLEDFVPIILDGELQNFDQFPINHVAIATGEYVGPSPLLIHASPADRTNALWPLGRFLRDDRYGRVYLIQRLRADLRRHGPPPMARRFLVP